MIASTERIGRRAQRRRSIGDAIAIIVLICSAAIILLPFAWIISTAFKTPLDGTALPPLIVFRPTLENLDFLTSGLFLRYEINSVVITVMATVVALSLGVPAGYALSLSRGNRSARFLGLWMLGTYMVPGIVFIVPLYLVFNQLGLTNTYVGIVLGYETGLLPFTAWMMRSYFLDVPTELEDAARVDGCSRFQAFLRVVLPVSLTGVSTVGLLVAVGAWGEYFGTLILGGRDTFTATIGIYNFVGAFGTQFGRLAMANLFVMVPILLATVVAQRGLLRGLTGAAVKG